MRDDIQHLARELLKHYQRKLTFLKKIHTSEIDKRYYLKTGSFDELEELISNDFISIEKINSIDVDIMSIKARICDIAGIENNAFERIFLNYSNEIVERINSVMIEIRNILFLIQTERDILIKEMEIQRNSLKTDIRSLSFYGKLKKD